MVISTAVNIYLIQIVGNRIKGMRGSGSPDFPHHDTHHVAIQKLNGKEIPAETLQHRPYFLYHIARLAFSDGKVSLQHFEVGAVTRLQGSLDVPVRYRRVFFAHARKLEGLTIRGREPVPQ